MMENFTLRKWVTIEKVATEHKDMFLIFFQNKMYLFLTIHVSFIKKNLFLLQMYLFTYLNQETKCKIFIAFSSIFS